jgi:hypothetical protein
MCLIKLLRRIYNPDADKCAPDLDIVEPELEFEAKTRDLGHISPYRGSKVYSYNFRTAEVLEVVPERIECKGPKGEKVFKNKILFQPGLLYVNALNLKNAKMRILKGKFEIPKKNKP